LSDAGNASTKPRILVAEDNPANQRLMDIMLRRAGYHVDIVANGTEAVRAVASLPYDVVLMDVHMPEMDGVAATRAIREAHRGTRHIPIIALTADALSGDRDRYLAAGMDDYISKPIDSRLLLELVALHSAADSQCGSTPTRYVTQDSNQIYN